MQVSSELGAYLKTLGLDSSDAKADKVKASQRTAISASAAVDKSGSMVQKWAAGVSLLVHFIVQSRFL